MVGLGSLRSSYLLGGLFLFYHTEVRLRIMAIQQGLLSSYAPPAAPPSGITFISQVATAGTVQAGVTSAAMDTTGATLILVAVAHFTFSGDPVVTDSAANTWTLVGSYGGSSPEMSLYYCDAPNVSATHTFAAADATLYGSIAAIAFSGTDSAPEDEVGAAATSTTLQPGSITPAGNDSVLISAFASGNSQHGTASIDSGFEAALNGVASGDIFNVALSYKIQTTAAEEDVEWTVPDSTGLAAIITVFAPA